MQQFLLPLLKHPLRDRDSGMPEQPLRATNLQGLAEQHVSAMPLLMACRFPLGRSSLNVQRSIHGYWKATLLLSAPKGAPNPSLRNVNNQERDFISHSCNIVFMFCWIHQAFCSNSVGCLWDSHIATPIIQGPRSRMICRHPTPSCLCPRRRKLNQTTQ